jgi:hypothetical protein
VEGTGIGADSIDCLCWSQACRGGHNQGWVSGQSCGDGWVATMAMENSA